jgi:hypothetical protein
MHLKTCYFAPIEVPKYDELGIRIKMINNKENPVAWAMLITELDEAREHLEDLINEMSESGAIDDESEFSVYLGHVYAHLNRAWHSRNQDEEISEKQWLVFSQFPKDIKPVG